MHRTLYILAVLVFGFFGAQKDTDGIPGTEQKVFSPGPEGDERKTELFALFVT